MGYDLHITRAGFWAENEGLEIGEAEWLTIVEADAELTLDTRNGPLFAVLGTPNSDNAGWLNWFEGDIYSKYPSRDTFAKMLAIAELLGATVQGDDGETYANLDDYPASASARQPVEVGGGRDDDLPLYLRRERSRVRLEFILVGLVVLAWVLYDILAQ